MVWCEAALILTIKWDEPDILLLLFFRREATSTDYFRRPFDMTVR